MTVEQNVLQRHSQKHQQVLLSQLRDATGNTDTQQLQQALQTSNGDLSKAVALLMATNTRTIPPNEASHHRGMQSDAGSQADTSDEKDDLQKAIALSLDQSSEALQETGVSEEEQAISRVLEASLAANQQAHSEPWSELPNPHDRKRQGNCPVGLKNVGNTCWFSAVIQSLFHLVEFQRLVLLYSPPEPSADLPRNQQEGHSVCFVRELRRLFALMLASKRKYVDPSGALEILNTAFQSSGSQQQQDVSEFTHRLLDLLEEAFQVQEERDGEKSKNPLVELFYGQFLAQGVLEGKKFENTEMFGQYPLQVNGFSDLYECLDAATTEGEIESLHTGNSGKSGQERWFTELPPVLTFELSRFQFNQAMGRPEKIHSKLEFPSVLYMDRYIYRNREITHVKREEMRRLREHMTFLQQQLERYLSYGSGPKRLPLVHVLQYAMEFASSKSVVPASEELAHAAPSGGINVPPQPTPSSPLLDRPLHPAPRHVTAQERQVLEGCLHRWRGEVETDIQELQGHVARTHGNLECVKSDSAMMQVPYRLHAVLVHEGQANAGHYWAYIYSPRHRCWMRYNDITVSTSSWEELMQDSYGVHRNTSAYCLIYVSASTPLRPQEGVDEETGQEWDVLETLPQDLRTYVNEDNQLFEKELAEWDATHGQQANQETTAAIAKPQGGSVEPGPAQRSGLQDAFDSVDEALLVGPLDAWREDVERSLSQAANEDLTRSPEALFSAPVKEGSSLPLTSLSNAETSPISVQPIGNILSSLCQPLNDMPPAPTAPEIEAFLPLFPLPNYDLSQPPISPLSGHLSPPPTSEPISNMFQTPFSQLIDNLSLPPSAQTITTLSPPSSPELITTMSPTLFPQPVSMSPPPSAQHITIMSPPASGQPIPTVSPTLFMKPISTISPPPLAQLIISMSPPLIPQPISSMSPPHSTQPITIMSPPPSAQPVITVSPPLIPQPVCSMSPPLSAQPITIMSPPPSAQPIITVSPPLITQHFSTMSPPPSAQPVCTMCPPFIPKYIGSMSLHQPISTMSQPPLVQPVSNVSLLSSTLPVEDMSSPSISAQPAMEVYPLPSPQPLVEVCPPPSAQPMGCSDDAAKSLDFNSEPELQ